MAEEPREPLRPEDVARPLQELSELYELGKALRELRCVDRPRRTDADRVRERPDLRERE